MDEIRDVRIAEPTVVAANDTVVIFVSAADAARQPFDAMADAQLYRAKEDMLSPVLPLAAFDRFVPALRMVDSPYPFRRPQ